MDVLGKRIVARLNCRCHEDIFVEQLCLAGKFYNMALLAPETNNKAGGAVLECVKRLKYPRVFMQRRYNRMTNEYTQKIGWSTDKITRTLMLSDLRQLIRGGEPDHKPVIDIPSAEALHQLRAFQINKDGKAEAPAGEYDDDVLALAVTVQAALQAAGSANIGDYVTNAADNEESQEHEVPPEEYANSLATNDAVDNLEDVEEDDED